MSALLDHRGVPFAAPNPVREHHETWAYYHLVAAANARRSMEREAMSWSDNEAARRVHEKALKRAQIHYDALLALGEIDPLIASMALTEGLTP